jgi:2'-5' RNA ligase
MRLFVAVDIGDALRGQLAPARAAIETVIARARVPPRVVWTRDEQAHVTLRFIGETDDEQAAAIRAALSHDIPIAPFEVQWDRVGTFGGREPRVIWIGGHASPDAFAALVDEVNRRLEPLVGPGELRPFRAHVTLGRVKDPGRGVDWARALEAVRLRPAITRVDHATLYVSRLSPRGPTYTAICTAQLR